VETKVGHFAGKIVDSAIFTAVIAVPLFMNIYSNRIFDDKVPLFRSIAFMAIAFALLRGLEHHKDSLRIGGKSAWRIPLVQLWLLMIGVCLFSTFLSINPRISFVGAYFRRQGAYTELSYMLFFILIALFFHSRQKINTLITTILLTSLPAALYGIFQHFDLILLPWGKDVSLRVESFLGNPIFFAAYLIMVIPITLSRLVNCIDILLKRHPSRQPVYVLLIAGYSILFAMQLAAVIFTQSRGPLLGLLAGLFFFLIILAWYRRNQLLVKIFISSGVIGILFLLLFNLPDSPLSPLRSSPYIGRMGTMLDTTSSTNQVRILIWEGVAELFANDPKRVAVGFGPEMLSFTFPSRHDKFSGYEGWQARPDRSHNETFDTLVTRGVAGLLIQLLLFGTAFYYGFCRLGLIRTRLNGNIFFILLFIGGSAGWFLPCFLQGGYTFSGVGLPMGCVAAIIFYLAGFVLTHLRENQEEHPSYLLLIALLSAILAHFIEVQFGIATMTTRLYLWIYLALLVLIGMPAVRMPQDASLFQQDLRNSRKKEARQNIIWKDITVANSIMCSLLLSVLIFNFVTLDFNIASRTTVTVIFFMLVCLAGGIILVGEHLSEKTPDKTGVNQWLVYFGISIAPGMVYLLIHLWWISSGAPQLNSDIFQTARYRANLPSLIYFWIFLMIGLSAFLRTDKNQEPSRFITKRWKIPLYATIILLIFPIIILKNLNISRADIYYKSGQNYEASQANIARTFYEKSLELQPNQDKYLSSLAKTYFLLARTTHHFQQDDLFEKAIATLINSLKLNPHDSDHLKNLTFVFQTWSALLERSKGNVQMFDTIDQLYTEVITLVPENMALRQQRLSWAVKCERIEKVGEYVTDIRKQDPTYSENKIYNIIDWHYSSQHKWNEIRDIYLKIIEYDPRNGQAWLKVARASYKLGDFKSVCAAYLRVLEIDPDIVDPEQALIAGQHTLESVSEEDRSVLEDCIGRLQQLIKDRAIK